MAPSQASICTLERTHRLQAAESWRCAGQHPHSQDRFAFMFIPVVLLSFCLVLRQSFSVVQAVLQLTMANSIWCWPPAHRAPSASASAVLGLTVCATTATRLPATPSEAGVRSIAGHLGALGVKLCVCGRSTLACVHPAATQSEGRVEIKLFVVLYRYSLTL